jgi:hypothetical protein
LTAFSVVLLIYVRSALIYVTVSLLVTVWLLLLLLVTVADVRAFTAFHRSTPVCFPFTFVVGILLVDLLFVVVTAFRCLPLPRLRLVCVVTFAFTLFTLRLRVAFRLLFVCCWLFTVLRAVLFTVLAVAFRLRSVAVLPGLVGFTVVYCVCLLLFDLRWMLLPVITCRVCSVYVYVVVAFALLLFSLFYPLFVDLFLLFCVFGYVITVAFVPVVLR